MTTASDPDPEARLRELEDLLAKTQRIRRTIAALRRATGGRAARPSRRTAPSGNHPEGRPRRSGR